MTGVQTCALPIYQFGQRFNGTADAVGPISRKHSMRERVPARITGVFPLDRILFPAEFLFDRNESHDTGHSLPRISLGVAEDRLGRTCGGRFQQLARQFGNFGPHGDLSSFLGDRKSTRLNSSHVVISYAVFCLKKKTDTPPSLLPALLPLPFFLQFYTILFL